MSILISFKACHLIVKEVQEGMLRMTYVNNKPGRGSTHTASQDYTAQLEQNQAVVHPGARHDDAPTLAPTGPITLGHFTITPDIQRGSVAVDYRGQRVAEDFDIDVKQVALKTHRLGSEALYGLGEKYAWMNRIETKSSDWCTDVIGLSSLHHGLMTHYHTAMPFFQTMLSQAVVGRYFDNSHKTHFDFDSGQVGHFDLRAEGGTLDFYLMVGDSVQAVTRAYTDLTGRMPLPRLDFLGYQQCRWSYMDEEEVLDIGRQMRHHQIPCDVMYLDIDYMDRYKVFTHDPQRFGNMRAMNDQLKSMGMKTVAIVDPGVKVEKGYTLYDEGLARHYFVLDHKNKPYVGQVWPGDSVYPDFLRSEVRQWWGSHHQGLLDLGIDGIWNDMNEPADSSTADKTLPSKAKHLDDEGRVHLHGTVHNLYGHYEAMGTYEALKAQQGTRPFLLTRAAFSGTHRYSALWTGDNSSLWEHLEASIPMLVNLGMTGYSYIGGDVGGFLNDSNGELLTRWTQFGAFMPLFRNHSSKGTLYQEPWCFGETVLKNVRKAIEMRYTLLTYLYSRLYEASAYGDPVLRPLFYEAGAARLLNIQDQCLFGGQILLAPVYRPGAVERLVNLPEGRWFHFETEDVYEGGRSHIISAPLDSMPVFVKEGTVLPKDPLRQYIDGPSDRLEIHLYGGLSGQGFLYRDDGLSFDYEAGDWLKMTFQYRVEAGVVTLDIHHEGAYAAPTLTFVLHGALQGLELCVNRL